MVFWSGYLKFILSIGLAALVLGSCEARLFALAPLPQRDDQPSDQQNIQYQDPAPEGLLPPPPILLHGEKLSLKYTIVWGLFVVYEQAITIEIQDGSYVIDTRGRTKGLASFLKGNKSHVWAAGKYVGDSFLPHVYQNSGKFEGDKYRRTLFFDRDGALADVDTNWPENWSQKYQREPVPEALKVGPDPISLLLHLLSPRLPVFDDQKAQPLTLRAFDGHVVSDYQIECKSEKETLSSNRKSIFSGEARPCYLTSEQIAGNLILTEELLKEREKERENQRKKKEKDARRNKDDEGDLPDDNRPKLWFASYDDTDLIIPVRAAVSAGFGTIRVYLREFKREKLKGSLDQTTLLKTVCQAPIAAARQNACALHR